MKKNGRTWTLVCLVFAALVAGGTGLMSERSVCDVCCLSSVTWCVVTGWGLNKEIKRIVRTK